MTLFKKDDLLELTYEGHCGPLKVVENEIVDHGKWHVSYSMVFTDGVSFWRVDYYKGATETQDAGPFENDEDEIECKEVHKVTKVIEDYE